MLIDMVGLRSRRAPLLARPCRGARPGSCAGPIAASTLPPRARRRDRRPGRQEQQCRGVQGVGGCAARPYKPDNNGRFEPQVGRSEDLRGLALTEGEAPPSAREHRRDQSLTDHLPVMVMRAGADALCDYVNRARVEFIGRPPETQLGLGWLEAVHPDDREVRLAAVAAAAAAGAPLVVESRLRRHDGAYRWVSERCTPLLD